MKSILCLCLLFLISLAVFSNDDHESYQNGYAQGVNDERTRQIQLTERTGCSTQELKEHAMQFWFRNSDMNQARAQLCGQHLKGKK